MTITADLSDLQIRQAHPDDAEALIAYCVRLTNEPHNNVLRDPGQWTMTVQEEHDFLAEVYGKPERGKYCIAEINGQIVGVANVHRGRTPPNSRTGMIGISVDIAWRGKGIGSALMLHLLDWSRENGLVRLELKVFTRNAIAIHLYEKLGFAIEGRHPYACCKQGVWLDELTMGLILKQPPATS